MPNPATPNVLVTGASSGIGEACTRHFLSRGWQVFAGVRSHEAAARLRAASPDRCIPLQLDVTQPEEIEAAMDEVRTRVGKAGLRGLVNNAGIAVAGPMEHVSLDRFRTQLEINVFGPVAMSQACLPLLRQGKGRIVNMSSVSGRVAYPFLGPYAASKHALEALSDSMRVELLPWGLHVSLIVAGAIDTPAWRKSVADARQTIAAMPEAAREGYGPPMQALMAQLDGPQGIPPSAVARTVERALVENRPRARYSVGDTRTSRILRRLPDRLRDALILRALPGWGDPATIATRKNRKDHQHADCGG